MDDDLIRKLDRLEDLIGICIRDLKYASNPKTADPERAQSALEDIAEYTVKMNNLVSEV